MPNACHIVAVLPGKKLAGVPVQRVESAMKLLHSPRFRPNRQSLVYDEEAVRLEDRVRPQKVGAGGVEGPCGKVRGVHRVGVNGGQRLTASRRPAVDPAEGGLPPYQTA